MEAERTYYYENADRDISYNQRKNKNYELTNENAF